MDAHPIPEAEGPAGMLGRKLDATGWGLFLVWVGVVLMAGLGWGLALLGTGVIGLGVQAARARSGLPVARWSVAIGACFALGGLVHALGIPLDAARLPAWTVPAAIAALGVAILVSTWTRRH